VPAGGIDEEISPGFPEAPFPQVVELGGGALPDHDEGQPAAAFAATAAGAGDRGRLSGFHVSASPSLPENYAEGKD